MMLTGPRADIGLACLAVAGMRAQGLAALPPPGRGARRGESQTFLPWMEAPLNNVLCRTLALAAVLSFAAMPASANCGAEGCPLSPQGLERAEKPWALDVGYQYVDQDVLWSGGAKAEPGTYSTTSVPANSSPSDPVTELYTKSSIFSVNGRGQLTKWLELNASLPYIQREHSHIPQPQLSQPWETVVSTWNYEGLGDAMLMATWSAHGAPAHGIGALALQAGVKAPTGVTHVPAIDGEEPEPSARPGTGSWDGLAGVQLMRNLLVPAPGNRGTMLPLVLSAMGRWNGTGTDGYRVGNDLHVNFSTSYAVVSRLSLLAQVNAVWRGRDDVGTTDAIAEETGGESVYATPGLRAALPGGASIYGYWQLRVYEHTNGPQLVAPDHLIFGASFGLGR